MPNSRSPYLTPAELAERWHVHRGSLANARSLGTGVPYIKLGSRVLYDLDTVVQYEQAHVVETIR